ncbi:hypothetical protein Ahy_B08g093410 isoform C [Arachis hypogaea]|uniref:Uncharacterized protein n=1 Tax=Arachis hypogaea TaxID=3818 RepID=A0A444Y676_ARAHY|nr:hypothetical protein Ahy_B08g093410 isoform C [Arachis hypogaea]
MYIHRIGSSMRKLLTFSVSLSPTLQVCIEFDIVLPLLSFGKILILLGGHQWELPFVVKHLPISDTASIQIEPLGCMP